MSCKCDESVGYLCDFHAIEAARHELIKWLTERYANCLSIAAQKTGADREGWIEDSRYFQLAIKLLADTRQH